MYYKGSGFFSSHSPKRYAVGESVLRNIVAA